MSRHSDSLRLLLGQRPMTARQLVENTGLSQPTVSRALAQLSEEIVRIGSGTAIQYAIRDYSRGLEEMPVWRVSDAGQIHKMGTLIPVRPQGFVMIEGDGLGIHSDGLPWWMFDMRPQGYLGRAYATSHAANLGLPQNPENWTETHALKALLAHGDDVVGNLLLGNIARDRFLALPAPTPIADRDEAYPRLALAAGAGEIPGSSAGGEQPKFCAYTEKGHVLVKFSAPDDNPVTERWRDLLLAEHLALATLDVTSELIDIGSQRFIELPRFDRIGELGRIGVCSLKALDAEFVGDAMAAWPVIVGRLATASVVQPEAVGGAALLWAFGTLIGNTDMHTGNLSFISTDGRPYQLAPVYDMLPMGFAPRSGGGLVDMLAPAYLSGEIDGDVWRHALQLAVVFLEKIRHAAIAGGFSDSFTPCVASLAQHIEDASVRVARMA